VREAANRVRCQSQLRQLGIACHNCQDQKGQFPPCMGYMGQAYWPSSGASYGNAFYHLLPFIEQLPLFEKGLYIDAGWPGPGLRNFYDADGGNQGANATANNVGYNPIKLLQCPSDPAMPSSGQHSNDWGMTSYSMNFQVFGVPGTDGTWNGTNARLDGQSKVPDSFPDGTSQTILFADKYAQCVTPVPGGTQYYTIWARTSQDVYFPAFAYQAGYVMPSGYYKAGTPVIASVLFLQNPDPWTKNADCYRASSGHSSGINVCLADASVRLVSKNVSPDTWWAAVTPGEKDPLGNDW
jgi:hypothetical protein